VNDAPAGGQANFIEVLSAVNARCIAAALDFKDIKPSSVHY
jgi:hypothetical protein